jgi:hypothetical protein
MTTNFSTLESLLLHWATGDVFLLPRGRTSIIISVEARAPSPINGTLLTVKCTCTLPHPLLLLFFSCPFFCSHADSWLNNASYKCA